MALGYQLVTNFATEHRGWFVTLFVLPMSLLFSLWFEVRAWVIMKLFSAPKLHTKRVQAVMDQLLAYKASGSKARLCTARGGWQSISPSTRDYKKTSCQIEINMFDILEINELEKWVRVEPLVSMGQLSHYLIAKGWTIPVLPEMDDLTVGGLFMGVGIETSSHKYGLFNDTVLEAEVVLADGTVLVCSKTQNRDLFDALPWSYGSLGFLLSVKIQLVQCRPYVRVQYIPCTSLQAGVDKFTELSCQTNPPDFVESLAYGLDKMVVMPAWFVDQPQPGETINVMSRWYKPWFYKHVEGFFTKSNGGVEVIPVRDYFHRHTRSIFWELQDIIPFGNNPLYRLLLGWAIPPKVSFLKLTQTQAIKDLYESQHVIQDMLVPMTNLAEALKVFDKEFNIYPLWLCPYRAYDYSDKQVPHRGFLRRPVNPDPVLGYEMWVDIGAYGVPQQVRNKNLEYNTVEHVQNVERYVLETGGYQMLYANSYLTRDEFRQMFDHTHLDQVKHRVDPTGAFPEVFEKTCKLGQRKN
ncbi:hypothetical protein BASA81_003897 [Batrachochytrium salamandrivorans]|nr:hypothetical protein BASA81_003897 [Batrachochytrium salamandrivorans]